MEDSQSQLYWQTINWSALKMGWHHMEYNLTLLLQMNMPLRLKDSFGLSTRESGLFTTCYLSLKCSCEW